MLTCRRCNNTAGSSLKSDAVRLDRVVRFAQGEPNVPVRADLVGSHGYVRRGEANWADDGTFMHVGIPEMNHPLDLDAYRGALGDGHVRFEIRPGRIEARRTQLAALRAAYLAAFALLGYRYILREVLEPVRLAVADLEHRPAPLLVHFDYMRPRDLRRIGRAIDGPEWAVGAIVVDIGHSTTLLPPIEELDSWPTATSGSGGTLVLGGWAWPLVPQHKLDV